MTSAWSPHRTHARYDRERGRGEEERGGRRRRETEEGGGVTPQVSPPTNYDVSLVSSQNACSVCEREGRRRGERRGRGEEERGGRRRREAASPRRSPRLLIMTGVWSPHRTHARYDRERGGGGEERGGGEGRRREEGGGGGRRKMEAEEGGRGGIGEEGKVGEGERGKRVRAGEGERGERGRRDDVNMYYLSGAHRLLLCDWRSHRHNVYDDL